MFAVFFHCKSNTYKTVFEKYRKLVKIYTYFWPLKIIGAKGLLCFSFLTFLCKKKKKILVLKWFVQSVWNDALRPGWNEVIDPL